MLRAFYLVVINSTIVSERPNCCMFQEFREREREVVVEGRANGGKEQENWG